LNAANIHISFYVKRPPNCGWALNIANIDFLLNSSLAQVEWQLQLKAIAQRTLKLRRPPPLNGCEFFVTATICAFRFNRTIAASAANPSIE